EQPQLVEHPIIIGGLAPRWRQDTDAKDALASRRAMLMQGSAFLVALGTGTASASGRERNQEGAALHQHRPSCRNPHRRALNDQWTHHRLERSMLVARNRIERVESSGCAPNSDAEQKVR